MVGIKKLLKHSCHQLTLFLIGGGAYILIELLFRGYSHWTMFLLGGLCFVCVGRINQGFTSEMPLISQMFISTIIVTLLEFIFGLVLNVWLKLYIWDYTNQPYNLLGQICLLFANLWFLLSLVAIVLDDMIRWKLFDEKKPHYHVFM